MISRLSLLPLAAGLALVLNVLPAAADEADYPAGGSIAIDSRICETVPVNPLDCPAAPATGPFTLVSEAGDVFLTMDEATVYGGTLVWGEAGSVPLTNYFLDFSYAQASAGYELWNLVPGAGTNGGGSVSGWYVNLSEEQPNAELYVVYVSTQADSDGDGASDETEATWGSDPFDPSDFPVDQAGPETGGDSDGDYLDAAAESQWGTDPNNPDSDGDGAHDGIETSHGSDPMDADDYPAPASSEAGETTNDVGASAVVATTLPNTGAGSSEDDKVTELAVAMALAGMLALGGVAVARQGAQT